MLRHQFIKLFALLLLMQSASPFCRALGADLIGTTSNRGISLTQAAPLPVTTASAEPTTAHETCWFEAAHLFNAPPAKSASLPLTAPMVVLFFIVLTSLLPRRVSFAAHWSLPYRSPPSQPLLQIFRI